MTHPVSNTAIIEAALFTAGRPLSLSALMTVMPNDTSEAEVQEALLQLQQAYASRGVQLVEQAEGWRFEAQGAVVPYLQALFAEKPPKYSRALLETLAIIAYQQPVTRGEIEAIRGVVVSTLMIKTLMEHQWITIVGHKDVPGKPALYATTRHFLDHFGFRALDELPALPEITLTDHDSAPSDAVAVPEQTEILPA